MPFKNPSSVIFSKNFHANVFLYLHLWQWKPRAPDMHSEIKEVRVDATYTVCNNTQGEGGYTN